MDNGKRKRALIAGGLVIILVLGVLITVMFYGTLLFGKTAEGTVTSRKRVKKSSSLSIRVTYYTDEGKQEDRLMFSRRNAPQVGDKIELRYLPFLPGTAFSRRGSGLVTAPLMFIGFPVLCLYVLLGRKRSEKRTE